MTQQTTTTQQEFLREAMVQLGQLGRREFAARLGCAQRTLDKWLLPSTSNDFRNMDETVWVLVREILAHEKLKQKVAKSACNIPNGDIQ